MSDRESPRWTKGTWKGHDHYRCALCTFDTFDYGAMVNHARDRHPREWEGTELAGPLDGIPFASPAAEELARSSELTAAQFTGQPTGATGYTLADVRRYVSAATPTEE